MSQSSSFDNIFDEYIIKACNNFQSYTIDNVPRCNINNPMKKCMSVVCGDCRLGTSLNHCKNCRLSKNNHTSNSL